MAATIANGTEGLWVIVELNKRYFGVAAQHLQQIMVLPEVRHLPRLPEHMRGVICLRDKIFPLMDLRIRLGMPSVLREVDDFERMIRAREEDHRKWLGELRASVREKREFTLATDPHRCAFGRWYDNYRSDDPWIASALRKFDEPHRRIHALAVTVKELQGQGDQASAEKLVEDRGRDTLAQLERLFAELLSTLHESRKEMVLILAANGQTMAVTVDTAQALEKLQCEELPAGAMDFDRVMFQGCAKRKSGEVCLLLESSVLFGDESQKDPFPLAG